MIDLTLLLLQMQYWPSDAARIHEVLPPFFAFIRKLAAAGRTAAQDMYGCPGWVAHGYSDGYLMTGVLGAYIWALCVTCGAWLALSMWDHLTYDLNILILQRDLLPVFRGIAEFFLSYFWESPDGSLHTGPTTSPETSYRVRGKPRDEHEYQLAMSPAFDMSVLRQVCVSLPSRP